MKHTVCQLFIFVSAVLLCALSSPALGQNAAASAAKQSPTATKQAAPAAVPAKEQAKDTATTKPAASAKDTATVKPAAKEASAPAKETAAKETSAPAKDAESQAKEDAASVAAEQSGAYQYFEYQVIAVPKKTVAAAAESMKLPKDSIPTDELLPAIYRQGGCRVIGYSAGYSAANTPLAFKMSRSEYFPDFYIMPNDGSGDQDDDDEDSGSDADDGDGDDEGSADDDSCAYQKAFYPAFADQDDAEGPRRHLNHLKAYRCYSFLCEGLYQTG